MRDAGRNIIDVSEKVGDAAIAVIAEVASELITLSHIRTERGCHGTEHRHKGEGMQP